MAHIIVGVLITNTFSKFSKLKKYTLKFQKSINRYKE